MSEPITIVQDEPANTAAKRQARLRHTLSRALERVGLTPRLVAFALVAFAVSRLVIVAITVFALYYGESNLAPHTWIGAWARWDATFYARLAGDGYSNNAPYRAAFFPLQPLLTALVRPLTGGDPYVASIVVSNLAYLAAMLGLAALAMRDWGDPATARRTMLYLTIFPSALFLFAGYAEALFLALAVWSVVAMRHQRWWLAGALGLLAAFSRQLGVLLVLPFAYEYAHAIGWQWRRLRPGALAVLLIPAGLGLYAVLLWHVFGDPLAFLHVEADWARSFALPWVSIGQAVPYLLGHLDHVSFFRWGADLGLDLLYPVLMIAGLITRRMRLGDLAYSAAVWLSVVSYPPSFGWPLLSNARFMLEVFPCLLLLAYLTRKRWQVALVVVVFGITSIMLAQYFARGYPIL